MKQLKTICKTTKFEFDVVGIFWKEWKVDEVRCDFEWNEWDVFIYNYEELDFINNNNLW